jgi:hypothetical protein
LHLVSEFAAPNKRFLVSVCLCGMPDSGQVGSDPTAG